MTLHCVLSVNDFSAILRPLMLSFLGNVHHLLSASDMGGSLGPCSIYQKVLHFLPCLWEPLLVACLLKCYVEDAKILVSVYWHIDKQKESSCSIAENVHFPLPAMLQMLSSPVYLCHILFTSLKQSLSI